jgi:hypothetical protein
VNTILCPYCSKEATLVIQSAHGVAIYRCPNDHVQAYTDETPFGTPINWPTRTADWFLGRS